MLTSSVNVVQSSFPEADQGEISGLSRSVSNLGSSLGTALVGSALVAVKLPAGKPFAVALTMMIVFTVIGLVLGVLIPRGPIDGVAAETPDTGSATRQLKDRDGGQERSLRGVRGQAAGPIPHGPDAAMIIMDRSGRHSRLIRPGREQRASC